MMQAASITLDLPADVAYLQVPGACLGAVLEGNEDLARIEGVVYGLQLAVYEVCTNIALHAYASSGRRAGSEATGRIRIDFTVHPSLLMVDLYDTGRSFDISQVPEPNLAEPQIGGYGLYLVRQLVDEVLYEVEPGGNHWRLTKRL